MSTPAHPASDSRLRVAVVGHVEWVDFVSVDRFPRQGEVLNAQQWSARPGGGGAVAAVVLAELGAEVDFFCALGRDAHGEAVVAQLRARGVGMHVAWRAQPTRRVITLLAPGGERTIVTLDRRLDPCGTDALDWPRLRSADAVYFTAGDREALRQARQARVLTATSRGRATLAEAGCTLDALLFSAEDRDEREWARRLTAHTRLLVATEGAAGGRWWGESEGRWGAVTPPGPARDAYGCGDSFAAAFTFGLAAGAPLAQAAARGAEWGARCLTRVGAP